MILRAIRKRSRLRFRWNRADQRRRIRDQISIPAGRFAKRIVTLRLQAELTERDSHVFAQIRQPFRGDIDGLIEPADAREKIDEHVGKEWLVSIIGLVGELVARKKAACAG